MRTTRLLMLAAIAVATLFMGKAATAAPLAPAQIDRLETRVQAEKAQYYVVPKSNTKFWQDKILRNQQRDLEVMHKLAEMGWHTIVVWECELKPAVREQTLESLAFTLNHIFLQDRSIRHYELPEEDSAMAAEPEPKHRE